MWKQTNGYDFLLSILCLLLLTGFSCSHDPETVSLAADSSTTLQCSDGKVLAFDRVEHGDDDCSVQVYRDLSTSCLGLSSCFIDTLAYDCADSGLDVDYRCVEADQIIDVCSVNGETIGPMELMYLTSPGYPSDTEYEKDLDCIVNYNEGKVSSTYLLDISMEPRVISGTGCLDRLRIRANHTNFGPDLQIDEVCGDNTHNLEGSSWSSTFWLDEYSMSLRFRTDDFFHNKYRGFILRVDSFPPATTTITPTPTTTSTTTATTTATFTTPSTIIMTSPSSAATSTMSTSATSITYSTTDPFDDCSGNPCQNGGTCNDDLDLYVCRCPTGYTGTNCEVSDPDTIVETTISPTATSGSSSPSMSADTTTEFTRTFVNECDSQPCQNGGTCEDDLHMYICTCPSGFAGDMCEILVPVSAANVIWNSCLTIGLLVCHLLRHL